MLGLVGELLGELVGLVGFVGQLVGLRLFQTFLDLPFLSGARLEKAIELPGN